MYGEYWRSSPKPRSLKVGDVNIGGASREVLDDELSSPAPVRMTTTREWAETAECNCNMAPFKHIEGSEGVLFDSKSGHMVGCPKHILARIVKEDSADTRMRGEGLPVHLL